jgi:hypothetical protein
VDCSFPFKGEGIPNNFARVLSHSNCSGQADDAVMPKGPACRRTRANGLAGILFLWDQLGVLSRQLFVHGAKPRRMYNGMLNLINKN